MLKMIRITQEQLSLLQKYKSERYLKDGVRLLRYRDIIEDLLAQVGVYDNE